MSKIRLVIIDDSQQMKSLAQEYFKDNEDYELLQIVTDGNNAYNVIAEYKPDIVLLDLVLPGKDGYCILQELLDGGVNTKVIVCTALSSSNFVHKAMQLGASYFVVKPCNKENLDRIIKEQYNNTFTNITKIAENINNEKNDTSKLKHKNIDERIANIFITVGIPAHIKGYQFLREAIKMTIESPDIINSITKKLYPSIAERFATSSTKVERAIRHAIEVAWNRGKISNINNVFSLEVYTSNEKPTNGEFIALVADKMLIESS